MRMRRRFLVIPLVTPNDRGVQRRTREGAQRPTRSSAATAGWAARYLWTRGRAALPRCVAHTFRVARDIEPPSIDGRCLSSGQEFGQADSPCRLIT